MNNIALQCLVNGGVNVNYSSFAGVSSNIVNHLLNIIVVMESKKCKMNDSDKGKQKDMTHLSNFQVLWGESVPKRCLKVIGV